MEAMWSIIGWMGLRGISVRSFTGLIMFVVPSLCKEWFRCSLRERNAFLLDSSCFWFLHEGEIPVLRPAGGCLPFLPCGLELKNPAILLSTRGQETVFYPFSAIVPFLCFTHDGDLPVPLLPEMKANDDDANPPS
jgi:hypothetical protein